MYLLLGLPYISVYRSTIALVSVSAGGLGIWVEVYKLVSEWIEW